MSADRPFNFPGDGRQPENRNTSIELPRVGGEVISALALSQIGRDIEGEPLIRYDYDDEAFRINLSQDRLNIENLHLFRYARDELGSYLDENQNLRSLLHDLKLNPFPFAGEFDERVSQLLSPDAVAFGFLVLFVAEDYSRELNAAQGGFRTHEGIPASVLPRDQQMIDYMSQRLGLADIHSTALFPPISSRTINRVYTLRNFLADIVGMQRPRDKKMLQLDGLRQRFEAQNPELARLIDEVIGYFSLPARFLDEEEDDTLADLSHDVYDGLSPIETTIQETIRRNTWNTIMVIIEAIAIENNH